MNRRSVLAATTFCSAVLLLTGAVSAQVYAPQSPAGLTISFQTERMGGGRVLLWGDVRNQTSYTFDRVTIMAEGLDDSGRVVSRGRAYVNGTVPPKGAAPFEMRFLSSGAERRFRVQVESFQQIVN